MAKAGTVTVDVKPVVDFTGVIAQMQTLAGLLITMGEGMAKLGQEINDGLVELQLQEMTR